MTSAYRIAYFITPHGYGHAARAAAVMDALSSLDRQIGFEIFTQVPRWFFEDSLEYPFGYHALLTDIGLAQKNSLAEDLPETVHRLATFLPFDPTLLANLARQVKRLDCQMIVCDISALGIAVAKTAGLPAVLVENFTWDWIYEGYLAVEPRLEPYITEFQTWFAAADYRLQTEPICRPWPASLTTRPVSRKSRTPAGETRQKLGLPAQARVVLLTMGGIPWEYTFLEKLAGQHECYFIIPGAADRPERQGNLVLLPHRSKFYHPDLVNAADAVIGKLGYSTVAEVYHAGIPFGYIARPDFRESDVLTRYGQQHMSGLAITVTQFANGEWVSLLPDLLALARLERCVSNGAEQAAQFMINLRK
jgi:UDP:flavonoid glycosyltransferase YjiC (YdhE family)